MALNVFMNLRSNGTPLEGESTIQPDMIECQEFRVGVDTQVDARANRLGRRQYTSLVIRKLIDRTSPLLFKALIQNERIDAEFHFFRPNPAGGQNEHYYTVEIVEGRIVHIEQVSESDTNMAAWEDIGFVFNRITWTHELAGSEYTDSITSARSTSNTTGRTGSVENNSSDTPPSFASGVEQIIAVNRGLLHMTELIQNNQQAKLEELSRLANDSSTDKELIAQQLQDSQIASVLSFRTISEVMIAYQNMATNVIQNMR